MRFARNFADEFIRRRVEKGAEAAYALFDDESVSPVAICIAITGDWWSTRSWGHFARILPHGLMRRELADFHQSIAAEPVRNRGAALNARLARLAKRLGVMA